MKLGIFCRIKSGVRNDSTFNVDRERNDTIVSCLNGPSFKFDQIFRESQDSTQLVKDCLQPLVNGAINGYNTSLLLFGEAASGKSHILSGNDNYHDGLFSLAIQNIYRNLESDERFKSSFKVRLSLFEVQENDIVDLIKINNPARLTSDKIEYSAIKGFEIKDLTEIDLGSAAQAVVLFRDAWQRRVLFGENHTDSKGTVVVHIKLILKNYQEDNTGIVSQLSFVTFPGNQDFVESKSDSDKRNRINGLSSLWILVNQLNNQHGSYGNYGESTLSKLLEDEIGGNCITHVLLCLPPKPNTDVLIAQIKLMNDLEKVFNAPIINTDDARLLLYNLRKQRQDLVNEIDPTHFKYSSQPPVNKLSLVENIKSTQSENVALREKVDELQLKLKSQYRNVNLALDKPNISDEFIHIEEEKLRSSKRIMDLEIRNNQLKEQIETVRFELQSKILHLEGKLSNFEVEKQVYAINSKEFNTIKKNNLELIEKLASIHKAYESLKGKADMTNAKNLELNLEFLNLLNNNSASDADSKPFSLEPIYGVAKIENTDSRYSKAHQEMRILSPITHTKDGHLKLRLGQLQEELQISRQNAQERLQKFSKAHTELILLKEENQQLQSQIQYLSKYLNTVSEEYKNRLQKTIANTMNILDSKSKADEIYKVEIVNLLKKYESSYLVKENVLRESLNDLLKKHESLQAWNERVIIEYISLREQIIENNTSNILIGPDPRDILRDRSLRNDNTASLSNYLESKTRKNDSSNIMELRQQIKEFGNTTIIDLEIERAQLLARNVELEEELLAAQNYIDLYFKKNHTSKSKSKQNFY